MVTSSSAPSPAHAHVHPGLAAAMLWVTCFRQRLKTCPDPSWMLKLWLGCGTRHCPSHVIGYTKGNGVETLLLPREEARRICVPGGRDRGYSVNSTVYYKDYYCEHHLESRHLYLTCL